MRLFTPKRKKSFDTLVEVVASIRFIIASALNSSARCDDVEFNDVELRNVCGLLVTHGYSCKERNESINLEERTHKGTRMFTRKKKRKEERNNNNQQT